MAPGKWSGIGDSKDSEDQALESRLSKTILKLEEIDKNIYR